MAFFHRRDTPPADVLARLPKHERVVSWADIAGGGVVLATTSGLWWPEPAGPRLIGWQLITKAIWRERTLVVIEAEVLDELLLVDLPPIEVELDVPRDLPPVVRKRIEQNLVRTELTPVPGGTARLVGRRVPGQDGVQWWARLADGTRDTPAARTVVTAGLEILRAEHRGRV